MASALAWNRRGAGIGRIAGHLLRYLPEPATHPPSPAVLRAADALGPRFGLPGAIRGLPGWDVAARAREVGLWGARLASLARAKGNAPDETVLLEAAAFNLAVALFDTVVDEMPGELPPLAAALHPAVLARCIEHADSDEIERMPVADELAPILGLFAHVLVSAGRRLRRDPAKRGELAELLRRMYASELGHCGSPELAKTLPVAWIGRLAGVEPGSAADATFDCLARFIARWDDAQDIRDDWLNGRYNAYLTLPRGGWSPLGGALVGASHVAFARRSSDRVGADLEHALRELLAAAEHCGRREVTACLIADLVGGAA